MRLDKPKPDRNKKLSDLIEIIFGNSSNVTDLFQNLDCFNDLQYGDKGTKKECVHSLAEEFTFVRPVEVGIVIGMKCRHV